MGRVVLDVYKRQAKDTVDVVLMDPPRSGSTEEFIRAVAAVKAKRVVYISCGPETLARDLEIFAKCGYRAQGAWPVDMFAFVDHTESVSYTHLDVYKRQLPYYSR